MSDGMSAFGPKRTSVVAPHMSASGDKADIVQTCGNGNQLMKVKKIDAVEADADTQ